MNSNERGTFLKNFLRDYLLCADLLFCFFVSALNSFRHNTVLRPFPNEYLLNHGTNETKKDFESLKSDVSSVKSLENIAYSNVKLKEKTTNLLAWLFDCKKFKLKLVSLNELEKIKEKVGSVYKSASPSYIFEIDYFQEANEKFEKIRNEKNLLYAYHGSRLENFHSILHHGLSGTLNKTALFGEGTYLSSELSLCLSYSPYGHAWAGSSLGEQLSCVAVCEMVDCEFVKCQISNKSESNEGDYVRNRARIEGSLGGDIPDKYYIVTNDDVIRVKYILVYASKEKVSRKSPSWYSRHSFLIMIITYLIILISIGFAKSPYSYALTKYFYSRD